MRISDWSSDVCSSDLGADLHQDAALEVDPEVQPRRGERYERAEDENCGKNEAEDPGAEHRNARAAGNEPDWLQHDALRSEGRREGKEGVSTCRSRWAP